MENASKALLIAGAILIAILLIGIGMMVFGNISGITGQSSQQMDAMEIQMFNSKFVQYEGENVSGSNVKALINNINANNTTYADDQSRQVSISGAGITSSTWSATAPVKVTGKVESNARYKVSITKNSGGYVSSITLTKK